MRSLSVTTLSVIVLVISLAAWAGVYFLYNDVSTRLNARAQALSSAQTQDAKAENAIQLAALASGTSAGREALSQEVGADVVSIANTIQSAGTTAGTQTVIGSASEGTQDQTSGASVLSVVVQSTGTFAQVWRAAQLFETLPLPSDVQELDFEQLPNATGGSWQLTAHINVLSTSQVSS